MIHDICYNEVIVLSDCFDKLCRHSTDDGIRRDIFGYYCSRCDNGIVPDAYSLKNGGIGAYPHVLAEYDWGGLRSSGSSPWLSVAKTTLCPI